MPALFEAYVTNLGKYNEGELVGEYLKFPTTPEEVQALLKRIGIDGVRYEEIFITDFDGDVLGLYDHLGEYENIDELNHLACVISELDQSDLEKFEAVIDSGEYTGSVKELINLAQNLDCFEFYSGISNEEELGRMYKRMDVDTFLETVRRYTDATTITKRMVAELIQYIEVYPAVKEDGITNQRVTIHYNCIGAFEVPDRRKIPERDILLETRKGVALSYAPAQIAI